MTRRNTRDQRLSYRVFPHFTMFCREETHDERLLTVGREWSELLEEEPHLVAVRPQDAPFTINAQPLILSLTTFDKSPSCTKTGSR